MRPAMAHHKTRGKMIAATSQSADCSTADRVTNEIQIVAGELRPPNSDSGGVIHRRESVWMCVTATSDVVHRIVPLNDMLGQS